MITVNIRVEPTTLNLTQNGQFTVFLTMDEGFQAELGEIETDEPLYSFKPEWISDTELQYEMPDGEIRIYKL